MTQNDVKEEDATSRVKFKMLKWRIDFKLLYEKNISCTIKCKFETSAIKLDVLYKSKCWAVKKSIIALSATKLKKKIKMDVWQN